MKEYNCLAEQQIIFLINKFLIHLLEETAVYFHHVHGQIKIDQSKINFLFH